MPDVTVGLFDVDARLYYVDERIIVIDNPYNSGIIIVLRQEKDTFKTMKKNVSNVLGKVNMKLTAKPFRNDKGLWCQEVKANGKG